MKQIDIQERLKAEKEAIKNCETTPIHDIGYIQPFGALLAAEIESGTIVTVSENITEWLPYPINEILGATLSGVLPNKLVHQSNNALGHSTINMQREHVGRLTNDNKVSDVYAHSKQNLLILELQPTIEAHKSALGMLDEVQRIGARLKLVSNEQDLLDKVVGELRALSGFNRVMAYRFLNNGAGEVAAESREPQVDSFLGLRFPAFDIPESARKLYETTPIRIIPSVTATQVKLLSIDDSQEPLDLSLALFRGHVAVHMMYLQNMGVEATLSLPITVNGKMWGLFAFHHYKERMLDSEKLASLELLGGAISMIINSIFHQQQVSSIEECNRVASSLFVPDESALGFSAYWDTASTELATLINCDGVAMLSEDRLDTYGACPPEKLVRQLSSYLDDIIEEENVDYKSIGIDSLEAKFPDLDFGEIAGVLAIPRPAISYNYLFYFRKDISQIIRWAGNPEKELYKAEDGFRLNPRASFAEYKETKSSSTFDHKDLAVANTLRNAIARTMSAIVVNTHHRERLGLVIRELNHRVRNMLALIGSIITQSKGSSHNIEEFVKTLELRLQALAETQKLLTEYDWKQVNIQHLFEHALIPYQNYLGTRLIIKGDQVALPPSLSSLLALIMNELASNALKYGALSNTTGKVDVSWKYADEELRISWIERDGPKVVKSTRHGFGKTLIEEALTYEFNADCQLSFAPEGVQAHFIIPVKSTELAYENKVSTTEVQPVELEAFAALVLEDDYIIAREMDRLLESLGATQVDTVPSIEAAITCIDNTTYDIAFLDANIRGEFSVEVAKVLEKKGIPFAFATGFGSKDQELKETACIAVLSKPVSKSKLLSILKLVNLDEQNA